MKPFEFIKAETTEDAIAALAEHGPDIRILAGGTDLLVDLKHAGASPGVVLDISRVDDLSAISLADDGLHIGAAVTHTEIMDDPLIEEHAPAMIDAAHTVGAVQTRNLGTIGGNLVTCVPSMDSGPVLMALEAEVTLAGSGGRRRMKLTEFFVGPRKTILATDELLLEIVIPTENLGKPAHFLKFGLRKGQALALVNVASSLWLEDGKITAPRIALGAVAPVVIRCEGAEAALEGQAVSDQVIAEAAKIAAGEARPIDDFRASKEYRMDLIEVGVRRTLAAAIELAGQEGE
ncbi:MAG: FAD binding domain-containing protein [Rhodospirillales bacterium]|jgi:carbon-monoxide dehydrogenase medium subunit|nr:carbon monoxide dehydrogenase [Rhodospirillaceae bacterium]MDP6428299.1 FAD binding domain-containing protein [Rhodospirillales bacterium]MDP6645572.1 FAD binding domain-containing protein [Rhodospirillales bacterium]MDP6842783.1 FAD binding domain-containing protein [Rhodospirillales bacterium]